VRTTVWGANTKATFEIKSTPCEDSALHDGASINYGPSGGRTKTTWKTNRHWLPVYLGDHDWTRHGIAPSTRKKSPSKLRQEKATVPRRVAPALFRVSWCCGLWRNKQGHVVDHFHARSVYPDEARFSQNSSSDNEIQRAQPQRAQADEAMRSPKVKVNKQTKDFVQSKNECCAQRAQRSTYVLFLMIISYASSPGGASSTSPATNVTAWLGGQGSLDGNKARLKRSEAEEGTQIKARNVAVTGKQRRVSNRVGFQEKSLTFLAFHRKRKSIFQKMRLGCEQLIPELYMGAAKQFTTESVHSA